MRIVIAILCNKQVYLKLLDFRMSCKIYVNLCGSSWWNCNWVVIYIKILRLRGTKFNCHFFVCWILESVYIHGCVVNLSYLMISWHLSLTILDAKMLFLLLLHVYGFWLRLVVILCTNDKSLQNLQAAKINYMHHAIWFFSRYIDPPVIQVLYNFATAYKCFDVLMICFKSEMIRSNILFLNTTVNVISITFIKDVN